MRILRSTMVVVILVSLAATANAQLGGGGFVARGAGQVVRALATQTRPPMRTSDRIAPYFGVGGLTLLSFTIWHKFFRTEPEVAETSLADKHD